MTPHEHKGGWGSPGIEYDRKITGTDNNGWFEMRTTGPMLKLGTLDGVGEQQPIDITPEFVTLKAWKRTA